MRSSTLLLLLCSLFVFTNGHEHHSEHSHSTEHHHRDEHFTNGREHHQSPNHDRSYGQQDMKHHDKEHHSQCHDEVVSICGQSPGHDRRLAFSFLKKVFHVFHRTKEQHEAHNNERKEEHEAYHTCIKVNFPKLSVECQKLIKEKMSHHGKKQSVSKDTTEKKVWAAQKAKEKAKDKAWFAIKTTCPRAHGYSQLKCCVKRNFEFFDINVQPLVVAIMKEMESKEQLKLMENNSANNNLRGDTLPNSMYRIEAYMDQHNQHPESKHRHHKHHKTSKKFLVGVIGCVSFLLFIALVIRRRRIRRKFLSAGLVVAQENIIIGVPLDVKVVLNAGTPENDNGLPVVDSKVITVV